MAIVDRNDWLAARRALLEEEKAFQTARDELAEKRRALPWFRIEKDYVFDGEDGPVTLADLFDGLPQLIVYHFMYHPDWDEGCKSCSFLADGFDGTRVHLRARDVALAAVSRAPLEKLVAYRARMAWRFPWVSSAGNDFNHDYRVSFTPEEIAAGTAFYNFRETGRVGPEMPGVSVFHRDGQGTVFHTYSAYARGLDPFIPSYQLLDITPKGRDEGGLAFTMQWVRRHDTISECPPTCECTRPCLHGPR